MKGFIIALLMVCATQIANAKTKTITFNTKNVCTLAGPVTPRSVHELKHCVAKKNAKRGFKNYPIYLYIKSPGGAIYSGLKFIEFAKGIRNLHTVTDYAASMASAIVEHLPGKRYAVEHNIYMFHRASGRFQGQFEDGELEKQVKFWKNIVRKMSAQNAKRINMTLKHYKEVIKDEWWIYGKDSVKMNICDEIVQLRCTSKLMKRTKTKRVRSLFGSYDKKVSECPMLN